MRNPLDQALHDAKAVAEWMEDNNEGNDNVFYATAWGEIQNVIHYLSTAQQSKTMNQYPRPTVNDAEQQKIGRMMMQIANSKGLRGIVTAATALGMENARLLAEVNEHRAARGFEPLTEYEPKM